jgi:hypothetical protein
LPVTPFHFGPGLALKGVAAPVFSWSAFAAAQVVIDCETIYYMVRGEYPVHRFLHSFLGGGMAGLVAAILFLGVVHAHRLPAAHRTADRHGDGTRRNLVPRRISGRAHRRALASAAGWHHAS